MKKNLTILLLALVAITSFSSCRRGTRGEGSVISETRSLSGFSSIDNGLDADIFYTQSPDYRIEIKAQQNILDIIKTEVSGNELRISYKNGEWARNHDGIAVYISGPNIGGITVNGSGSFKSLHPIHTSDLFLRISGSGSISLSDVEADWLHSKISGSGNIEVNGGEINKQKIEISGSGDVDVLNAEGNDGEVSISGSGNAKLWVDDNLSVRISGSGDVTYRGNPSISSLDVSGSGKVKKW